MATDLKPEQALATRRCDRCFIHHRGLCRAASNEAVDRLNHASRMRRYDAGEVILAEGGDAPFVGNVVSGTVRVTKILPDGRRQIVGLLFESDFFGHAFEETARFSVEAATDATVCLIDRRRFESILGEFPTLQHELLVTTLDELDHTRERLVMLGCQTSLEKVATFFLMLQARADHACSIGREPLPATVVSFPVSRHDIASYLSTTVETLSRHIHLMSREKVIRILDSKRFEILDLDRLADISGRSADEEPPDAGIWPAR